MVCLLTAIFTPVWSSWLPGLEQVNLDLANVELAALYMSPYTAP